MGRRHDGQLGTGINPGALFVTRGAKFSTTSKRRHIITSNLHIPQTEVGYPSSKPDRLCMVRGAWIPSVAFGEDWQIPSAIAATRRIWWRAKAEKGCSTVVALLCGISSLGKLRLTLSWASLI